MKIDFLQTIKTLEGEAIPNPDSKTGDALTLKTVCINSLLASDRESEQESGEKKYERYLLAQKIHAGNEEEEFKAEDVALIKKLVGKIYIPLVVGRAFEMLDK